MFTYMQVKIAGSSQELGCDILQLCYQDSIGETDTFNITINNWDAGVLKYTDGELLDPGTELELWMGGECVDELQLMVRGKITVLQPIFAASGMPTVSIRGVGRKLPQRLKTKQASVSKQPLNSRYQLLYGASLLEFKLERSVREPVKGTGSAIGNPVLRAGTQVGIDGVGIRFSGRYLLTSTTHTINGSGYRTAFDCRRWPQS